MRIAHVTDGYPPRHGGIELQIRDPALRQAAFGHDVDVVTMTPANDAHRSLRPPRVTVHRPHAAPQERDPRVRLAGTWQHSAIAVDRGYDLVHAHLSVVSPLALNSIRRCVPAGVPVAITVHSVWGPWSAQLPAAWLPPEAALHTAWSGVSSAVKLALSKHTALDSCVIPNGVDTAFWHHPAPPSGGDHEALRLFSAMRLTRRKRPMPLVRAVRDAASTPGAGQLTLTIAGSGPLEARVRSRASRAHNWSLCMPGQVDRSVLLDLLGTQAVFVAPARLESFGLAALEARSAGLPVVAWRTSGVADHVTDGQDALLVDSDLQMANAITRLATEPGLLARLQQRCADPPTTLGWTTTLAGYDDLYERAMTLARGSQRRRPLGARP